MSESTLRTTARLAYDLGGRRGDLDDRDVERLWRPECITEVTLDVPGDASPDGTTVATGWRVRHSTRRGPAKGGIRLAEAVGRDELLGLAALMTLKCALTELPYGGGKGGLRVDLGQLDDDQHDDVTRRFAEALAHAIGPHTDVVGPDVGTGPDEMLTFVEAARDRHGELAPAVATGKPLDRGGIELRTGATARGAKIAVDEAVERLDTLGRRVSIQGFGSLGAELAQLLADDGFTIVAVSDSSGTVHDPDGLDVADVRSAKQDAGSFAEAGLTGDDDALTVDCDILVPCALEGAVDGDVARATSAGLVVEGANGPSTDDALKILAERNVAVVPDFLANAGGVTASFLEWAVNVGERSNGDDLAGEFDRRLTDANVAVWDDAGDPSDLRAAAASIAMRRVLDG